MDGDTPLPPKVHRGVVQMSPKLSHIKNFSKFLIFNHLSLLITCGKNKIGKSIFSVYICLLFLSPLNDWF